MLTLHQLTCQILQLKSSYPSQNYIPISNKSVLTLHRKIRPQTTLSWGIKKAMELISWVSSLIVTHKQDNFNCTGRGLQITVNQNSCQYASSKHPKQLRQMCSWLQKKSNKKRISWNGSNISSKERHNT